MNPMARDAILRTSLPKGTAACQASVDEGLKKEKNVPRIPTSWTATMGR